MPVLHHLNCVKIETPAFKNVIGHCILIENDNRLVLIDTGFGWKDVKFPDERIGLPVIEAGGFQLKEELTALRQIEKLGYTHEDVTDCIVSHLDPDHAGGLADFPGANVHVSSEEWCNFQTGNSRYFKQQLAYSPEIKTYDKGNETWLGLEARPVKTGLTIPLYFIPLFGHTNGHCGVAFENEGVRYLYAGDAYYLLAELTDSNHPVHKLATMRADDNEKRLESVEKLKKIKQEHPDIVMFGYHDYNEFLPFIANKTH